MTEAEIIKNPTTVRPVPVMRVVGLVSFVANCTVQAWSKEAAAILFPQLMLCRKGGSMLPDFLLIEKAKNLDFCVNLRKLIFERIV